MEWFRFYHRVAHDPKVQTLPAELFKAWVNILCLSSESSDRWTVPNIEHLSFHLRMENGAVHRVLEALSKRGLLDLIEGHHVIHDWDYWQADSDSAAERMREYRRRKKESLRNGDVTVTDRKIDRKIDICPDEFNSFWSIYPRKEAKTDALRAWGKLAPSPDLQTAILSHIEQRKKSFDWMKEGGKYIPLPATFLNGRRWEDETGSVNVVPLKSGAAF